MKDIHWFPGHMKKAKIEISERVKLVDLVIEIVDSRAPFSTRNKEFVPLINNKPKLVVLSKQDLSDDSITSKWVEYFLSQGITAISGNINDRKLIQNLEENIELLMVKKREKEKAKGIKRQPVRAMIIGIPNVGKSTLINKLSRSKSAGVQNKPGFTKSEQWIRVNKDFELLDTPGVLPMSYDDKNLTINLASIGSVREDILPLEDLADFIFTFLKTHYKNRISKRYEIEDENLPNFEILSKIAEKRGYFASNKPDINKASRAVLNDFKNGLFGKVSLEEPNA